MTVYDRDLKVLSVSPSVQRLLGYSPSDIVGKTFPELDILAPESVAVAVTDAMRVFSGEAKENSEYVFVARDGSRMYGEVCGIPVMKDGKAVSVVGVARDITDRKLAEAAQRSSEASYRVLFQQSPLGIFVFDTELIITECNERLIEILRSSREKLVGFDLHGLKDRRPFHALMEAMTGRVATYEGSYEPTTGMGTVQASFIFSPLLDEAGVVIGGVATLEDIRDRLLSQEKLRRSEEIHRALFQQSLLGIFTFDKDMKVTDCNDRILEKIGVSREVAIGFDLHGMTDRNLLPAMFKALGGETGTYEGRYKSALGKRVELEVSVLASPLRDTAGGVSGAIVALEDITLQKKAQEELRSYSERLEELVTERTRQLEKSVDDLRALNDELEAFFRVARPARTTARYLRPDEDAARRACRTARR
jgi:PAS domain S-box-containing protein